MANSTDEQPAEATAATPEVNPQEEDDASESDNDDDRDEGMEGTSAGGGESGYDTDPIERFFVISKWQRQLRRMQDLRNSSSEILRKDGPGPLKKLRERRRQISSKIIDTRDQMVGKVKKRREQMVGNFRQRQEKFKQSVDVLKGRTEKVLQRMRVAKVRQFRHMFCFVCSMTNLLISSFWLGRFPQTFHWWYTANCVWLIGCRAVWYRWHGYHLFLLDLCYWVNAGTLAYLWFFNTSAWFFTGIYGCGGVLVISVILFRNSFIPHSLDAVTSFQIHVTPVVQLWLLRFEAPSWPNSGFNIPKPEEISMWPGFALYLCWASVYYTYMFGIAQKKIERRGYETLYKHMAINMGMKKKLPKRWQAYSKAVFMVGHMILFISGIPFVHFPYWLYTITMCLAIFWGFRNGATFYLTYFWKVYETQIHEFERQMARAEQDAAGEASESTQASSNPQNPSNDPVFEEEEEEGGFEQQQACSTDEEGSEAGSPL